MRQFIIVCGNMLHRLCLVLVNIEIFLNKCVNFGLSVSFFGRNKKAHIGYGLFKEARKFLLYVAFN